MSQELRQHFEKITQLTDQDFEYILSHFKTKKLKKHQFLIQEGAKAPADTAPCGIWQTTNRTWSQV